MTTRPSDPFSLPTPAISSQEGNRSVIIWLGAVYVMIFAMVLVGGTTRLTGSGLSMVQWHPLMGTFPPSSPEAWDAVFSQYKQSPQFELVNGWMNLAAFKKIFFWEYLHRLLGRLIGLVMVLPWLYFVLRKKLTQRTSRGALFAVFLGGGQGILGWYMVSSGLVDIPEVSHFRLAAHLILALLVSQWILWMLLDMRASWKKVAAPLPGGKVLPIILLLFLYAQIMFGAFVAGKRAGLLAVTFPDMNGHYLPGAFFFGPSALHDILQEPLAIHYMHRALGTFLLLLFVGAAITIWRKSQLHHDRLLGLSLLVLIVLQFSLGAATVLSLVAIPWAITHQGGAFILLGCTTAILHRAFSPNTPEQVTPQCLKSQSPRPD